MLLKIAIVVLFIAVLISLSSGLVFLMKDIGTSGSKRTLYALGIRIGLAASLLILIAYGLKTGQLGSTAPWDPGLNQTSNQASNQGSKNQSSNPPPNPTLAPNQAEVPNQAEAAEQKMKPDTD